MSIELKIKEKTLAYESRIIRKEELKCRAAARRLIEKSRTDDDGYSAEQIRAWRARAHHRSAQRVDLHEHRLRKVRPAARATHLARGFLKGTAYRAMERTAYSKPDWAAVEKMIKQYGRGDSRDVMQKFSAWKDAA